MKANDVVDFLQDCIFIVEAGGYQELEESSEVSRPTPDDWGLISDSELWFRFGRDYFRVSVRRWRKPSAQFTEFSGE
jgi:hypothetical protein